MYKSYVSVVKLMFIKVANNNQKNNVRKAVLVTFNVQESGSGNSSNIGHVFTHVLKKVIGAYKSFLSF